MYYITSRAKNVRRTIPVVADNGDSTLDMELNVQCDIRLSYINSAVAAVAARPVRHLLGNM